MLHALHIDLVFAINTPAAACSIHKERLLYTLILVNSYSLMVLLPSKE